jgi:WD40 repeat protein
VFAAFANELEARRYLRQLPEEARGVERALQNAPCAVLLRYNVTLQDLVDVLQSQEYRSRIAVVHYGGHAGGELLSLEHSSGDNRPAHAKGLAALLGQLPNLRLVFLNGCATQGQVEHLQAAGVPAVLATSDKIDDAAARNFAVRLYQGLAEGQTIGAAVAVAEGEQHTALGSARAAYRDALVEGTQAGAEWPWKLHLLEPEVEKWSLSEAAGDPLFGLPPIPKDPPYLPKKPFRHLNHFTEADAEVFFGRSARIRELYENITAGGKPVLFLYGQSGVGKSSLLDAGLTPRLKAAGYRVGYARRDAWLGIAGTLKGLLGETTGPRVWVLDQLEEAYTRAASPKAAQEEMAALAQLLAQHLESPDPGRIILSFRKEWLSEIETALQYLPFTKLAPLEALDLEGIKEAIAGPTTSERLRREYRLTIEPGLPDEMAADLLDRNSPIGPTLQLTLTKMWDQASTQAEPRFDLELYESFKRKGLGEILEQQLGQLDQIRPEESQSGLVLDLLAFHTTALGTSAQRTEEELVQQYGPERMLQIQGLLQACKDLYLLSDPPGVVKASRLSHDTLAPYVRRQFEQSELPGQRARRILESRAVDWDQGYTGSPLDGYDLRRVEQGLSGMRQTNADEKRLIKASEGLRDEQNKQQASTQRFRRVAIGALVALMLTAFGLAGWSVNRANVATASQNKAQANQYMAQANQQKADNYDLAVLLNLEANRIMNSLDTRKQLLDVLYRDERLGYRAEAILSLGQLEDRPLEVVDLEFSPDGKALASANLAGQVVVWNVLSRIPTRLDAEEGKPRVLGRHADQVAYSPDGKLLAAGGWNGNVAVWSVSGDGFAVKCPDIGTVKSQVNEDHFVSALGFKLQGTQIVTGHKDGSLQFWDTDCSGKAKVMLSPKQKVQAVQFVDNKVYAVSQDRKLWCVEASSPWQKEQGRLELKSPVSMADQQTFIAIESTTVGAAAFHKSGQQLWLSLQDPKNGKGSSLLKQTGSCAWSGELWRSAPSSLAFEPAGWRWASAENQTLVVSDIAGSVGAHTREVVSLAFQPQGSLLAAGDRQGRIVLWNASSEYRNPILQEDFTDEQLQGRLGGIRARACHMVAESTWQKADDALKRLLAEDVYRRNCTKT